MRRKQHDLEVLKVGLNNQINEKLNNETVNRNMERFYGQQLRDKDNLDYEREKKEQQYMRDQQKTYFKSLNSQVREVTNRKRFEDMMTDQERQLN